MPFHSGTAQYNLLGLRQSTDSMT